MTSLTHATWIPTLPSSLARTHAYNCHPCLQFRAFYPCLSDVDSLPLSTFPFSVLVRAETFTQLARNNKSVIVV